tara:strand:- start:47925 stop:48983 length:1059 start_codon:yes stop_codon:yes gene_type:complete
MVAQATSADSSSADSPSANSPSANCADASVTCWCKSLEIPKELLAKLPEAARGIACICQGCSNAAMSEPAQGVRKTIDPGGREAMQLTANGQTVLISHTGAQVLSWQTDGGDVLWTASAPEYAAGKPVRGGVPVVFPWFGDHKSDPSKPAHGFARSIDWHCSVRDAASATFSCGDTPATRAMWDYAFRAELTVSLTDTLQIAMTITNTDDREFSFEQALHTYLSVGDIHEASVHGLQGVPVVEHAREPEGEWDQSAPIRFRAETDRVFQQVPDELMLQAPALDRTVTLRTSNSRSTIVWNPWPNKTARLSQMHADDWQSFVCVESANAFENAVRLAPGASHEMTLTLSVASD